MLPSSEYFSSPNYSSVPANIYGEFLSEDLDDFVDNFISGGEEVWDTNEKGKTTITDVKYDFLNVVSGKVIED